MIEIVGYKENPMYTIEQVRNVIDNVTKTLKLDLVRVFFYENSNDLHFVLNTKNASTNSIESKISYDIHARQPKIILNYKNLKESWFQAIFDDKFKTAKERSSVIYIGKRRAFVTRVSTILEFIENDHSVTSFLMSSNEIIKKNYKVNDIINSDYIFFELFCFEVFSDGLISSAESVQDLIDNFDKHVALNDMKAI